MHKIERKIKIIVNSKTHYNSPSPGGRELEGGGNLAEFTLTLFLSLQGRGIYTK
jgi:hypothetical protein